MREIELDPKEQQTVTWAYDRAGLSYRINGNVIGAVGYVRGRDRYDCFLPRLPPYSLSKLWPKSCKPGGYAMSRSGAKAALERYIKHWFRRQGLKRPTIVKSPSS